MILRGVPRGSCRNLPAGLVGFGEAVGDAALDIEGAVHRDGDVA